MTYDDHLQALVDAVARGDEQLTRRHLADLTRALADAPKSEALIFHIFARALYQRVSQGASETIGNLYLASFELPQIELFDLVARGLPSVAHATSAANQILLSVCRGRRAITLLDVGIGEGRQLAHLMRQLAAHADAPRHVSVIGIEPSERSLQIAQRALAEIAHEEGFVLDFNAVHAAVESMSAVDWQRVHVLGAGAIVNASFALHHIRDGHDRDHVLRQLRALEPTALVLTEPDVDHAEPDLRRRFGNCWDHFRHTFRLIDATALDERDKDALKVSFFGREISDILGSPERERCERHETLDAWRNRLTAAGFGPAEELRYAHGGVSLTGVLWTRAVAHTSRYAGVRRHAVERDEAAGQ